jgi:4-amino-4-deoxy-L-arabinose transferase-like glycosyltransferase
MSGRLTAFALRRDAWVALIAVSLVLRLAVVFTAPRVLLWPDGRYYESIAYRLATEHTYGDQTIYAPAYPTLIATVYGVFGRSLIALRVVEAVLATATVALVGAFGFALFGPLAGLVAATLAAIHPVMVLLPTTQYAENLILFVSALAFGQFALAVRSASSGRWLLAGGLFGLLTLVKPNAVAFLPGLAAGAVLALARNGGPWLKAGTLFVLALAVTLAPWMVRNHRLHDRWFLVTTGGGRQFWLGNNADATGATNVNPTPPQWLVDSLYAHPDRERESVYYREGWRYVREHPGRALKLYVAKMAGLWSLSPRSATRTAYSNRISNAAMALCSLVLYVGALIGLFRLRPHNVPFFPLAILSFTLMSSAFLMVMRYRMSFEVLLLWMAGVGIGGLVERSPAPARR